MSRCFVRLAWDVTPSLAGHNQGHRTLIHPEPPTDGRLRNARPSKPHDGRDVLLAEFRQGASRAPRHPVPLAALGHVVYLGAQPLMCGIAARWVVAGMVALKWSGPDADCQPISHAMSAVLSAKDTNASVTVVLPRAHPGPTVVGTAAQNLRPEARSGLIVHVRDRKLPGNHHRDKLSPRVPPQRDRFRAIWLAL